MSHKKNFTNPSVSLETYIRKTVFTLSIQSGGVNHMSELMCIKSNKLEFLKKIAVIFIISYHQKEDEEDSQSGMDHKIMSFLADNELDSDEEDIDDDLNI